MGFLKVFGRILEFEESEVHFETLRREAVETIITWMESISGKVCCPKFGYEVKLILY
jgi:hypothetical protein